MNPRSRRLIACSAALAAAALAAWSLAGPLDPPAGPVAPTYRTLAEVEPRIPVSAATTPGDADSLYRISQPGSYYLTGNIAGVSGKDGIEIASPNVTLDLRGFEVVGVPSARWGILGTVAGAANIVVENGTVRAWGRSGIDLGTYLGIGGAINGVRAIANGDTGITSATASTVSTCVADENTGVGLLANEGSTVTACTAVGNGVFGIASGVGSTIVGCSARQNTQGGIVADGSSIINCAAANNTYGGILSNGESSITGCAAYQNTGVGISAGTGGTVTACSASLNTTYGFWGNGATISNCTARYNTLDGIQVSGDCRVFGNTCSSNGFAGGNGAGIHATGGDNRIEGNNCSDSDRGIDVDAAGNFITRNTCSGNTLNWEVAAGNVCMVVQAVSGGVAISGNSGGPAPGSTDPNANFTY